jgi:HD-GYP domain-containing protein (c-di-GMP phosphodiesterase class II)
MTSFRIRAFALILVPFSVLLGVSFWLTARLVEDRIKRELRESLRRSNLAISRFRTEAEGRNRRLLQIAGENPALKAGMELLRTQPTSTAARATLEDQLAELGSKIGAKLVLASAPSGQLMAGVTVRNSRLEPVEPWFLGNTREGLALVGGNPVRLWSVAVSLAGEQLGSLSFGEAYDLAQFPMPAFLRYRGRVVASTVPGIGGKEIESAVRRCRGGAECELILGGTQYLGLPMAAEPIGNGFELTGVQNEEAVVDPFRTMLERVFAAAAVATSLLALFIGLVASRALGQPLALLVGNLSQARRTGVLPEFDGSLSSIREIHDLMTGFNEAALSIRSARDSLRNAYVEFVGSLANALDARDRYTAGHSQRVSDLSARTAQALGLPEKEVERIAVGALLHDIGKIGVSDEILRKPGRLTEEEFGLVKLHPVIGRRILEGGHGFSPYLDAVELHHENWDGTGYPHGQRERETPVAARIIHVADAYDAMTTDRPYSPGMDREHAVRILQLHAGTQFDPLVVEALVALTEREVEPEPATSLHRKDPNPVHALPGTGLMRVSPCAVGVV